MDDTRLIQAKECLHEALVELENDEPNIGRVTALLDDSRSYIIDVVEEHLGCSSKADVNQLDGARLYINRSLELLFSKRPREWVLSSIEQFLGGAVDHIQVVLSGNVVPLRARRSHNPGGGAA